MIDSGVFGFIIILFNLALSYYAFNNRVLFDQYKFEVDGILIHKEYKRMITSGFLHVGWIHLAFNMLTLHGFSGLLELYLGGLSFLFIYFASLLGGNFLSLYVHRNHGDYSAVGASGAVSGVVFASIALFPDLKLGFFGLTPSISSWFFGLLFVVISIYGIKSGKGNIGHDAHLGGALVGMLIAIILKPSALTANLWIILLLGLPIIYFIILIIRRPEVLLVDNFSLFPSRNPKTSTRNYDIDQEWNAKQANKQKEIDKLLDKIRRKGIDSLTTEERKTLEDYSNEGK